MTWFDRSALRCKSENQCGSCGNNDSVMITGEPVDVGVGEPKDYNDKKVEGKIVMIKMTNDELQIGNRRRAS